MLHVVMLDFCFLLDCFDTRGYSGVVHFVLLRSIKILYCTHGAMLVIIIGEA